MSPFRPLVNVPLSTAPFRPPEDAALILPVLTKAGAVMGTPQVGTPQVRGTPQVAGTVLAGLFWQTLPGSMKGQTIPGEGTFPCEAVI